MGGFVMLLCASALMRGVHAISSDLHTGSPLALLVKGIVKFEFSIARVDFGTVGTKAQAKQSKAELHASRLPHPPTPTALDSALTRGKHLLYVYVRTVVSFFFASALLQAPSPPNVRCADSSNFDERDWLTSPGTARLVAGPQVCRTQRSALK